MVLGLLAVFVFGQAQSSQKLDISLSSNVKAKATTQVQKQVPATKKVIIQSAPSDIFSSTGSGEVMAIPDSYSTEQKGINSTDDLTVLVLDHNGYISSGRIAPSNGSNYQRAIYLLTPDDLTASGIPSGLALNSIGWQIYGAGTGTMTGTLNVYLMNTTDAAFSLGTDWATTGFSQVYNNASYTIPIAAGWFDLPFTTNFNYTGGGIYVAWEFSSTETPGTAVVTHLVNTTLVGGTINQYSNTALPTTLLSNNSRPMTRVGVAGANDIAGVSAIYTLEKAPDPFCGSIALGAGLFNITASDVTTDVTIEVRKVSDNSLLFTNTQLGVTLTASVYTKVTFASWNPATTNDVKYTVFTAAIPGDTWTTNNTKTILGNVNTDTYSYFYTPAIATNYGFGTGTGIFSAKFNMTGSGLVTGANIVIGNYSTNTGNTVQAVMLNSAGAIVATAPAYVLLAGDLGTSKSFTFTVPVVVTNDFFYVGLLQVTGAAAWYPMGCANEVPQRGATFYTFASTGGTPSEFTLDYKYLLEAVVSQSFTNDMSVGAITSPASGAVGVQNVTITVVNAGTTSQSNIPVHYEYNSNTFNGTVPGPVAGGGSVSYTFPQTIDPPLGPNTITACTDLVGDQNTANDCQTLNFNITPAFTCEWTIDLYDYYGDGWNGGELDVVVDGFTVLDNITLADGFGPATYTFGVDEGSAVQTIFVVDGSYPEECSYEVYNNFGALVGTTGPTLDPGIPPPGLVLTGSCECSVTCPAGSLAENEPQIGDEGEDVTNGGCNMLPLTPLFTPIALGDTYCGTSTTYTSAGGDSRDTDWYRIDLTSPNTYWNLNFSCTAEFPLQILILNAGDPDDCTQDAVVGSATAGGCETAVIDGNFPSGVYYFWVGPSVYTGYPSTTGPHNYVATLTGSQLGAPVAAIDPLSVLKTIEPDQTSTMDLSVGNTGSYVLNYSGSTPGVNNQIVFDNFEPPLYTAGGQIACQNPGLTPTTWTTWSNLPCDATEDGYISSNYAYSGTNSAVIAENNDQIKLLGDFTTGKYNMSFQMYIPAGHSGYFNTLSDFTIPYVSGGYWAFECYFNAGGAGSLTANHTTVAFTWVEDAWQKVEFIVDLDSDVAEFWMDGTFIYSWPWSEGSSTGTGPLKLAANDFFGAAPTDEMYIDDYTLNEVQLGWLTLDGGTAVSGSVNSGDPADIISLGFDATGKPNGTYNTNIYLSTNELGSKVSYVIPVQMNVGYTASGTINYDNTAQTIMNNVTVQAKIGTTVYGTGVSDAAGAFAVGGLSDGVYTLGFSTSKAWGGCSAIDVLFAKRFIATIITLTPLQQKAGDVNNAGGLTALDVLYMKRRIAGITVAQWNAPDFIFDVETVTIAGGNTSLVLKSLCSGDVNSSYTPPPTN